MLSMNLWSVGCNAVRIDAYPHLLAAEAEKTWRLKPQWTIHDWGWVKELCAHGVEEAVKTGRWTGIATSNFCGPQFTGMWRDVDWHQRLTKRICEFSFA